jgi:carbonic anhydrase
MDSSAARQKLIDGNQRFVTSQMLHPRQSAERRVEVSSGQRPFAAVLSCADSRVPPEIIFDQGIGDLFVVRVAGNVVDDMVLGSLEYAVAHLHIPLIAVVGHTRCGAVNAALAASGKAEGHVDTIISAIEPAIQAVGKGSGNADQVVRANAVNMADRLRNAPPILRDATANDRLQIVAACYDIQTGVVAFV